MRSYFSDAAATHLSMPRLGPHSDRFLEDALHEGAFDEAALSWRLLRIVLCATQSMARRVPEAAGTAPTTLRSRIPA
jgi:hypothetical protein